MQGLAGTISLGPFVFIVGAKGTLARTDRDALALRTNASDGRAGDGLQEEQELQAHGAGAPPPPPDRPAGDQIRDRFAAADNSLTDRLKCIKATSRWSAKLLSISPFGPPILVDLVGVPDGTPEVIRKARARID